MIKLEIVAYIIFMVVFTVKLLGVVTNRDPVNTNESRSDKLLVVILILLLVVEDMIAVLEQLKTFIEGGYADLPITLTLESAAYMFVIAFLLIKVLQKVLVRFSKPATS